MGTDDHEWMNVPGRGRAKLCPPEPITSRERFYRRDGTVIFNGRFIGRTGWSVTTVREFVGGTGRDGTAGSVWQRFHRPVPPLPPLLPLCRNTVISLFFLDFSHGRPKSLRVWNPPPQFRVKYKHRIHHGLLLARRTLLHLMCSSCSIRSCWYLWCWNKHRVWFWIARRWIFAQFPGSSSWEYDDNIWTVDRVNTPSRSTLEVLVWHDGIYPSLEKTSMSRLVILEAYKAVH